MATKIEFDQSKVKAKIESRLVRVQKRLDAQVMKDSNYFCPMDTGALQKSVLGSQIGSGILVWAKDYAKKMYHFGGKLSKDSNTNASIKWFEVAKARYKEVWEKIANDEYRRRS